MNELIEDYLRLRGVRYFRGHHDDEFFYLVDCPGAAYAHRLSVHLEVSGAARDSVRVAITPDRFYPARHRDTLIEVAARWNAADPAVFAVVHDSSDPALVGVMAQNTRRTAGIEGLAVFVDHAVESAMEVFCLMGDVAGPPEQGAGVLRDAG